MHMPVANSFLSLASKKRSLGIYSLVKAERLPGEKKNTGDSC